METGHEKLALRLSVRKFKELAMKFEPAQIIRKSTQAIASWWSNEAQFDTN